MNKYSDSDIFLVLAHLVKRTHAGEIKWKFKPKYSTWQGTDQHEGIILRTDDLYISIEKHERNRGFLFSKKYFVYQIYMCRYHEKRLVYDSQIKSWAIEGTNFLLCDELMWLVRKEHNKELIGEADSTLQQVLSL